MIFFGKLEKDELDRYRSLVKKLSQLDDANARVSFNVIKSFWSLIDKFADYTLNSSDQDFSKSDKRVWKKIKANIQL